MSTWKTRVSSGIKTTPPPRPVSAPSSPATTDPKNTSKVKGTSGIQPPLRLFHEHPRACRLDANSRKTAARRSPPLLYLPDDTHIARHFPRHCERLRRAADAQRIALRPRVLPHPPPRS